MKETHSGPDARRTMSRTFATLLLALVLGGSLIALPIEDLLTLEAQARRAETAEARVEALEAIAALQVEGEPAQARITQSLAIGLSDDAPDVRKRTAALLDHTQHAETAVRVLAKATRSELKAWNKAGEKLNAFYTSGKASKLLESYWTEAEAGVAGAVDHRDAYNEQIAKHMAEIGIHAGVLDGYIAQLATWPDDRSVGALSVLLKEFSEGQLAESEVVRICLKRSTRVSEALLILGSQDALESLVDSLMSWDKRAARSEKTLGKMRDAKPGEYGPWEINYAESNVRDLQAHLTKDRKSLKEFASANDLPRPPGALAKKSAWRSWKGKARGKLPKKLGTVSVAEQE